jgi:hypothetical protein
MMINSEVSSFCTEILLGQLMELLMEQLDLRIADLEYYQPQQGTQNKICVHGFDKLQMASTHVLEWRVAILTLKHNLCIRNVRSAMLIEAQSWHEKLSTVPAYRILNQGSRVWSCQ